MTDADFRALLLQLADGWHRRDYAAVARHFSIDVRYGDPLRYALRGRDELLAFFSNDDGLAQHVSWHTIIFDEQRQQGAAEYTYQGTHQYHGTVLVRIEGGMITHWREYQHIDPRSWHDFAGDTRFPGDR